MGTVQAGQPQVMEPPCPRLCHLRKWVHFQGYGFNLHTDRSKESQLVGNVDEGSPADAAGVKKGDKIIEVNGINISNENHTQVVARSKATTSPPHFHMCSTSPPHHPPHPHLSVKRS